MKKDLVDIVMEKEFIELSSVEREELSEFCSSEDEYNQMKEVFLGVELMQFEQPTPRKETKESLDNLFDKTYPKAAPIWYMSVLTVIAPKEKPIHRQPLMQIAALVVLLFLVYPFFQGGIQQNESTPMAEVQLEEPAQPELKEVNGQDVESDEVIVESNDEQVTQEVTTVVGVGSVSPVPSPVASSGVEDPSFDHPDGIYRGDESADVAISQPASEEPELLDLLTATF